MCNFVRVSPHYGFFYSQVVRKVPLESYSLTTCKVKTARVLKSLHIALTDHWFLTMLEIRVKLAYGLHMLKVNRKMCTRNQMLDSLRSILQCTCLLSWIISGFFTAEYEPATESLCGKEILAELTRAIVSWK